MLQRHLSHRDRVVVVRDHHAHDALVGAGAGLTHAGLHVHHRLGLGALRRSSTGDRRHPAVHVSVMSGIGGSQRLAQQRFAREHGRQRQNR